MTGREPGSPASLWKEQAVEVNGLSPHEARARLDRLDGRIRMRNRIEYVAGAAAFAVFAVFVVRQIAQNRLDLATFGALLLMLGVATVGWQLHRRTGPVAIDGARPSVETYRAELRRQRDALASVWLWYVAPCLPGMVVMGIAVLMKVETRLWPFVGAVAFLMIGFMAWVIHINLRAARALDVELEGQVGRG